MARQNQTAAKARSVRIPLDYLRRRLPLNRWKIWLSTVAALIAAGYVAWGALGPNAGRHYSPGRLAAAHAMWENRCNVCHQEFVPVRADAWTENRHGADLLCQNCHRGAEHSPNQIAAEVGSCASCHHDHRGFNADLSRIADSTCTACHADIAAHLDKNAPGKSIVPGLANVTNFVTDHPEFRSPKLDPAHIKFSHWRHMQPGLMDAAPMLLSDLSPADRDYYRQPGQTDASKVMLTCASCHQLDRSGPVTNSDGSMQTTMTSANLPVRASGDYMLPITYEQNCKACHQLNYIGKKIPTANNVDSSEPSNVGAKSTGDVPRVSIASGDLVPHGWSDERLRRYVEQMIDMEFINESDRSLQSTPLTDMLKQPLDKWRLPNRPPPKSGSHQTVGDYLQGELLAAVKNLRLQCAECHGLSDELNNLSVAPASSHPAWLEHASFSHVAHRAVSCQACHVGAFSETFSAQPRPMTILDDQVFIPDRKVCLQCHSPPQGEGAAATGGARFDCVECHRYHNGDSPWHGRGDAARAALQRITIPEFIQGQPADIQSRPTD
ncbi:MAG TPA: cytochrome c3 family protein [Pirellulales bacterium]